MLFTKIAILICFIWIRLNLILNYPEGKENITIVNLNKELFIIIYQQKILNRKTNIFTDST